VPSCGLASLLPCVAAPSGFGPCRVKSLNIDIVELGTGNYPGDAHCKLAMLEDAAALAEFQRVIADHGATIAALSCHGDGLHSDKARAPSRNAKCPLRPSCSPRNLGSLS